MELCLASFDDQDIILELRDELVYINGQLQPIKHVTEDELVTLDNVIKAIPVCDDPGYDALVCAKRAEFIVSLLGRAVGEECVDFLSHILDHLHFRVQHYLDEGCDCENHHA